MLRLIYEHFLLRCLTFIEDSKSHHAILSTNKELIHYDPY